MYIYAYIHMYIYICYFCFNYRSCKLCFESAKSIWGKFISCLILPWRFFSTLLLSICLVRLFPSSSLFWRNSRVLSSYSCFRIYYKIGNVKGFVKKYLKKIIFSSFVLIWTVAGTASPPPPPSRVVPGMEPRVVVYRWVTFSVPKKHYAFELTQR